MQEQEQSIQDELGAAIDKMEKGELEALDIEPVEHELAVENPEGDMGDEPKKAESDVEGSTGGAETLEEPEPKSESEPADSEIEDAPQSWRKDVADEYKKLPAEVRAEIQRRENDYHKGIEGYKPAVQFAQEIGRAIAPFKSNIENSGVPVAQAVNHLLLIEDRLRNGDEQAKYQTVLKIASDYGIDLQKAVQTSPDPRMWQLERQLHEERMARDEFQRSIQDRDATAATSEIESFAADPLNEHFVVVRGDMAQLLQSGIATSLQDAYDRAVWARPDLRKSLVEKERTEAEKRAIEQARKAKAKSAASGVKGSPPSSSGALKPDASVADTVRAAVEGLI
ncbi:hypothetical protein AZ20_4212 [Bordetella bronchiseptica E014]|uniref:hypothetical protein n=1 Tax=Bordetella bronchiseptica TaxID=518 RepID=UPI00049F115B|nr:hypothetical protein [Bordetella bronchiseptica]KDC22964.1 hypothetical protein AZ20_4212 [Bordetella bronchiseptica E014]